EAGIRYYKVTGVQTCALPIWLGRSVDHIDGELRGRPFLVGHDLTLADVSVGCGLAIWTGALGGKLPEGLAGYQDRLRARPAHERSEERRVGKGCRRAGPACQW